ncbi:Lysine histidine transporter-like 1 [Hibiscus syriacus]|uniref:Lysine histidine transporter-like 1 n=1 Tax=Hibiscus syriacus TaxID=106335 RepID=A0A6A3AV75_HIBSY|nr:Lysine histidine transporter-like 1 [Hibiscus syriacus]
MGTHQPPPPSNGDYAPNNTTRQVFFPLPTLGVGQLYVQEKSEKQKAIDDWLPINSSRSRKWWFSAFHNVTAMVGAGVLSLPYAMAELGWGPGVFIMVFSWIITLYTLWQMVEMHELVPGKRFDRYHELGQYAFGEKLGLYIVVPQQLVVEVSLCIVYMVTGGQSLKKFHDTVCPSCKQIKLTYFIMIFASVEFVLSHLPNFDSISGVSLAAAVMSLSYSTIAWAASLSKGVQDDVQYGYKASTTPGTVFGFLSGLGDIAFAYSGHNVVLEIQATIESTPERPSKGPMWKGVVVAYIVIALCYFPVALIGYWMFGNSVRDNILLSLEKPAWLIAMANMFVVIHVIGSYQIYAMPVFDMIETLLVKKLDFPPSQMLRFIVRNSYVAITMFFGITFPFFGGLLGFFGGLAFAPTTYFLPCIMWLVIYKPKKFGLSWWTNWLSWQSTRFLTLRSWDGVSRKAFHNMEVSYGSCSQPAHVSTMGTESPPHQKLDPTNKVDEDKLKKQKEIDDWLPITSSRDAKWWYAAFHNVTAMVGAGVLSLPYAMSHLRWGPGVVILILLWVVTLCTLWQMVKMHEMVPGKRFDPYHELGQHAFGEKLGLYIVVPQQLIVEVGVDIVYMVTGGKSLEKICHLVCDKPCKDIKTAYFIMIFSSVHFVLAHLPNFNSISGVSLAAAVMSLTYSTIACTASVQKGVQPDVQYGYKAPTPSGTVLNFFTALGDVAFAYAGHNVVLEIQATIPSKGPMWRVDDNILITLEKPRWLIVAANMFVVIHVIGSYQLYAMPVFDIIEMVMVKKWHFRPTQTL